MRSITSILLLFVALTVSLLPIHVDGDVGALRQTNDLNPHKEAAKFRFLKETTDQEINEETSWESNRSLSTSSDDNGKDDDNGNNKHGRLFNYVNDKRSPKGKKSKGGKGKHHHHHRHGGRHGRGKGYRKGIDAKKNNKECLSDGTKCIPDKSCSKCCNGGSWIQITPDSEGGYPYCFSSSADGQNNNIKCLASGTACRTTEDSSYKFCSNCCQGFVSVFPPSERVLNGHCT
mmetsp:Transcript_19251/g.27440  ORF Transcript_19251/g.27440 Transcript_19251/m.27440 type:complete len:232 (-) Transcript_19251:21-716(-)